MNNREYQRQQRETNPQYRLRKALSQRLREGLRFTGVDKNSLSIFVIVGYTKEELIAHLERCFKPGMTLKNFRSKWHIDHIIPMSKFDLNDPEQIKACFALTNLRPLWAGENRVKGDKIETLL